MGPNSNNIKRIFTICSGLIIFWDLDGLPDYQRFAAISKCIEEYKQAQNRYFGPIVDPILDPRIKPTVGASTALSASQELLL